MKREIGNQLEREFDFEGSLVTVHEVDVTPDLRSAHVFIGIVGNDEKRGSIIQQLEKKRGHIQTQVMKRVTLKYTPQIHFRFDDSIERGVRVVNLLDEIAQDLPADESNHPSEDEEWEENEDRD